MNIFKIIAKVIKEPTDFFNKVGKGKEHLGFAFGYYALLSLFGTVMGTVVYLIYFTFFTPFSFIPGFEKLIPLIMQQMSVGNIISQALIGYVLGLGLIFVFVGLLHVWILVFGGKKSYVKTFELAVFAGTPAMLLRWIPFFGFAGTVWSIILLILGTEKVHGLSRTKSILMYVIPIGILFLLGIIAAAFFIFFVGKLLAAGSLS